MGSSTKRRVPEHVLAPMIRAALPGRSLVDAAELGDGNFNTDYLLTLDDGAQTVLKVAPPPDVPVQTYETAIMGTEIRMLGLVRDRLPGLRVPRVLHSDDTGTLWPSPWFVADVMPGTPLSSIDEGVLPPFHFQLGRAAARIAQIHPTSPRFGIPALPRTHDASWARSFQAMLRAVWADAARVGVDLGIGVTDVARSLERDRALFDEVQEPALVHFDLWEGNAFAEGGRLSAIIDWERALWADPLIEFGFRSWRRTAEFVDGFQGRPLDDAQLRRATWYDLYYAGIIALEDAFRASGNPQVAAWGREKLAEFWESLRS